MKPNLIENPFSALVTFSMLRAEVSVVPVLSLWLMCQVVQISGNWYDRTSPTPPPTPNSNSRLTASYFFPYACGVIYKDSDYTGGYTKMPTWVSACTIFSHHWVAACADSFNTMTLDTSNFYYHDLNKLEINAGTTYGAASETATGLRNIQRNGVESLVYHTNSKFLIGDQSNVFKVSGTVDASQNMTQNAEMNSLMSLKWNVVFLKGKSEFTWSPQILPAPLPKDAFADLRIQVSDYVDQLNAMNETENCVLAAWNRHNFRLGFYTVHYVPMEQCRAAYCQFDTRACLNFPDPAAEVCFKSLTYGSDACPEDRGSALYCKGFQGILGVVSMAPNCGFGNLPSVYTLIDRVVLAYEKSDTSEEIKSLDKNQHDQYTLPASDFSR